MNTVNIADMDAYHLLGTQVVLMEFKITSSNPWLQSSKLLYNPILWDDVQKMMVWSEGIYFGIMNY